MAAAIRSIRLGRCLRTSFLRAVAVSFVCPAFWVVGVVTCQAQTTPSAQSIADALLASAPQAGSPATWSEETGRQLEGLSAEWYNTANGDYFRRVRAAVDAYLDAQGKGSSGKQSNTPEGDAELGRQLMLLYRVTLAPKYYEAATALRDQLADGCGVEYANPPAAGEVHGAVRNACVAQPFLAEYASIFHRPQDFGVITYNFLHWGAEPQVKAIKSKSQSPERPSGRDNAYLAAALVDSLPYYPQDDAFGDALLTILNHIAATVSRTGSVQLSAHGPDSPAAACLYVYALFKGVRLGYLQQKYSAAADRMWRNVVDQSGKAESEGKGELLLAATEAELASTATADQGKTVLLDGWYNSQQRKDASGQMGYFHYKWSDMSDSGYSLLGHIFASYGAKTEQLYTAPSKDALSEAQFYIIASPDIPVKNPNPHYMTEKDAEEVVAWVNQGGVLVLMENDPPNADIDHLNLVATKFGIHFDNVLVHHILGEHVEDGRIAVSPGGPVFHQPHTFYMKDTCAISVRSPATAVLRDHEGIVMATAKYGRGTVFAVVDPWLYNEYTDGRKNPQIYKQFDNFAGGREFVRWLLEQAPKVEAGAKASGEKQ